MSKESVNDVHFYAQHLSKILGGREARLGVQSTGQVVQGSIQGVSHHGIDVPDLPPGVRPKFHSTRTGGSEFSELLLEKQFTT